MSAEAAKSTVAGDESREVPFWKTLYGYTQEQRKSLIIASLVAMFVGGILAARTLVIKPIVDKGILREDASPQERLTWTLVYVAFFIVLSVGQVTIWGFGYSHMLKALEGTLFNMRARFFRHVQSLCFRFHDEVSSGELYNYVMGSPMQTLKQFVSQFAMAVPVQVVSWVVAFIALLSYDWLMLLVLLGVVSVAVLVNLRSRAVIRRVSADFMQQESQASRYVADMFRGTRAIKIHAVEDTTNHVYVDQMWQVRERGRYLGWKTWVEAAKPELINYFGMGVLYLTGAYSVIYREMSIGTFTAFINSVGLMIGPLMAVLQLNLVKSNAEAGLERIERVMQREGSTPEPPPQYKMSVNTAVVRREELENPPCVQFDNVTFSYDGEHLVFGNLNVNVFDGQSVALVGPSGSGKSSFVNLLLRLYDPQEGRVLLYGRDVRGLGQRDLRASFGVVMQDPFFFQATIRENVRVGYPEATDEDLARALKMAEAWDFVMEQPQGLDTLIGESGVNLSGGQKQRLAIARAILSQPRFYVFDEATAALDNRSEARVQAALEALMKDHTTFIIAHRLSTIRNVDRILVFDHGEVVQDGSYDELASTPGVFQDMLNRVA